VLLFSKFSKTAIKMSASVKKTFTVRYCENCDGGEQELGAASEAIRRVFRALQHSPQVTLQHF
jgi:hypothetical protein